MSLGIPIAISRPIAVVMVGLPARGKTYIARKLARYLSWTGYRAEVFNVGNVRRERFGAKVPASFFDPANEEGLSSRKKAAHFAMDEMLQWYSSKPCVSSDDSHMFATDCNRSSGSFKPFFDALSSNFTLTGRSSAKEQPYPKPAACRMLHPPCDSPVPSTATKTPTIR